MRVPSYFDIEEDDTINDEANNKNKISDSKTILPFLKVKIEKNLESNNIPNKLEKTKSLINSQTDKLLITGFQGNEDDFKECYKKDEPIKIRSVSNNKKKKLNKLLVKDDYMGPIKLTKIDSINYHMKKYKRY